ncbi:MAG: FkbM family methyltransferase [Tannerellaceae bacterium]|nr:FkbM family methyltransferase [Tannerellaceae bacterium]
MPVEVMPDHKRNLKYVVHTENRKLYFPASFPDKKIEKLYKSLLIEQDIQSAHHYVDSIEEFGGKTILDIGSAEGLTSLEAIEIATFIYFFECQQEWISALNATFEPWKDKIMIVEKFVSDKNGGNKITLDEFLKDKPKEDLFIKMDIEGEERHALEGVANVFLTSSNLQFALCTYHKRTDKNVISSFLDRYNCTYSPREGFFYTKHKLRTALIRGCTLNR